MHSLVGRFVAVAVTVGGAASTAAAQTPKAPALRDSILALDSAFTATSQKLLPEGRNGTAVLRPTGDGAMQQVLELRNQTAEKTGAILDAHGWPGKSLVGVEASHAMLRLVRTGKLPLKKKALESLRRAAADGDASPVDMAYLEDDVHAALGEPQTYGTALRWSNNHFVPTEIGDSASVDKRRAQVGLGPLADSLSAIKIVGLPANAIKPPLQ